jgi:hypothetical protein
MDEPVVTLGDDKSTTGIENGLCSIGEDFQLEPKVHPSGVEDPSLHEIRDIQSDA